MKLKLLLVTPLLSLSLCSFAQLWTNAITDPNPSAYNPYTIGDTPDANVNVSGISRGTGITAASASARYSASGWNSASLDANDYFEFTLTPNPGCTMDFSSFVYTGQASGTGPQTNFAFRSSLDGYTTDIGTPTLAGTTISLAAIAYQGVSAAITFRFYAWGASSSGGTFSINDFTFNGTTSCGPTCTPPATQASSFASSSVNNTTGTVSWVSGSFANTLVVIHQGSAVNADPATGSSYSANSIYGFGSQIGTANYVVYDGTGNSVSVTGLTPGTTYYFAIYSYDPNSGSPCYNKVELTGNFTTTGTASKPLEIESILVDACNGSSGTSLDSEPYNEMVRFKVGASAVSISGISIAGGSNGSAMTPNVWPNAGQAWHGLVENANTATKVSQLNATISACGYILEPPAGVIPGGAEVIMVCSQYINTTLNSFANLNDTIYMIFQDTVSDAIAGHFVNYNSTPGTRELAIYYNGGGDTVSYERSFLIGGNGAGVQYDVPGNATYYNNGCQAPFEPLSIDAGSPSTICFNGTANLTATTSSQYASVTWSGGTGTFGTPNSLTTTYAPGVGETSGTVHLFITLTSNCGTTSIDSVTVTLNPAPTPTVTSNASNNTVCSGAAVTLTASGGTSYLWNTTATTNTITVNPTATTTYSVDVTNSCSTVQATFTVNVNQPPAVTATNTGAYCAKDTIYLNVDAGYNYSWTGPNTFTATIQSPTINNATTVNAGTYTVIVTDPATSCKDTVTTDVVVNALPVPTTTATVTNADCGLTNGAITGGSATGPNPITLEWVNSTAPGIVIVSGPDVSGLGAGVYNLVATDDVTGCSASSSYTVNTNGGPANPTFAATNVVCEDSSFTITVSNPVSGADYTWSLGAATVLSGTDSISLSVSSATSANVGPYTVEVTVAGCSNTSQTSVNFSSSPVASVSGAASICAGDSTVLDASASTPSGVTFQWYESGNPISGETSSTYTVLGAGNYQVQVTNSDGCPSFSSTSGVTVNPIPHISVSNNAAVCLNDTVVLVPSGAVSYAWSPSVIAGNGDTILIPGDSAGTFTYMVTGIDVNSCSGDTTVEVIVNPVPTVLATGDSACINDVVLLTASGADTYQWIGGTTPATGDTVSVPSNGSGVFTYIVVGTQNNCTDTVSVEVVVNDIPQVTATSASACINTTATIVASGDPANYSWSAGTVPSTGETVTVSASAQGTTTYTVTATDANGCVNTATASLVTNGNPVVTINGLADMDTVNLCLNVASELVGGGASTYVWSTLATTDSISYTTTTTDTSIVTVVGTDSNGCVDSTHVVIVPNPALYDHMAGAPTICNGYATEIKIDLIVAGQTYIWATSGGTVLSTIDSVQITAPGDYVLTIDNGVCPPEVIPFTVGTSTIDVSFTASDTIGVAPLTVNLTNTSSNVDYYWWDFGNGTNSNDTNAVVVYTDPGTYVVYLAGTNDQFCFDQYSIKIIVLEQEIFVTVPNVFTPNGDHINDEFSINSYGIESLNCKIYDRWGLLMTELNSPQEKWVPSNSISDGTYFFILNAKGIDGKDYEAQGFILLTR